jgi:hypothetical protein
MQDARRLPRMRRSIGSGVVRRPAAAAGAFRWVTGRPTSALAGERRCAGVVGRSVVCGGLWSGASTVDGGPDLTLVRRGAEWLTGCVGYRVSSEEHPVG